MTGGLPAFPQSRFPNDLPPTIFSPASPKVKTGESEKKGKDMDAKSVDSQATFSSTISLIRNAVKNDWVARYKENRANRKDDATSSPVVKEKKSSSRKSLPKDPVSPRQRTAEAYMYVAHR